MQPGESYASKNRFMNQLSSYNICSWNDQLSIVYEILFILSLVIHFPVTFVTLRTKQGQWPFYWWGLSFKTRGCVKNLLLILWLKIQACPEMWQAAWVWNWNIVSTIGFPSSRWWSCLSLCFWWSLTRRTCCSTSLWRESSGLINNPIQLSQLYNKRSAQKVLTQFFTHSVSSLLMYLYIVWRRGWMPFSDQERDQVKVLGWNYREN